MERIKGVIDFAAFLHESFITSTDGDLTVVTRRLDSLNRYIDRLSELRAVAHVEDRNQLDIFGTKLWNTCTRLIRNDGGGNVDGDGDGDRRVLCRVRLFAFLMLECGAGVKADGADNIRVLKVGLKAAKTCLDVNELGLALKALEKAATREETLPKCHDDLEPGTNDIAARPSAEYYILRITLAWQQDRLDIAELMYSKLPKNQTKQDPATAERLANLLYDLGTSLFHQKKYDQAQSWLRRSYEALSLHELDRFTADAPELRLLVLVAIVRTNLALQLDETAAETPALLDILERDYGNRLPVIILNLEMLSREQKPSPEQYYDRLGTMLRTVRLTEANLKIIMHHVYKLKEWDVKLAAESLRQLLLQRLVINNDDSLLERCLVTLIWTWTGTPGLADGFDSLVASITSLRESWTKTLSAEATYASLILLWRKVDQAFGSKEYDIAAKWCQLAQNPIFENAGETNKAKLQRKLITCALGKNDTQTARQIFSTLSGPYRSEKLTRYLMYKVALLDDDIELGRECLDSLYEQDTEAATYILACVAEAQRSGSKYQAAIALQKLLDRFELAPLKGVNLPALLRCTARLLVPELSSTPSKGQELVEQICNVFESALTQAVKCHATSQSENPFNISELDWFSRNSYNLAAQYCTQWEPQRTLRLLNVSIKLIDLYPPSLEPLVSSALDTRRLLCDFLGAIISMAQARIQTDERVRDDFYLDSRIHVQSFRGRIHSRLDKSNEDNDLVKKYQTLLAFDFEAAVRLRQWDLLGPIVKEAWKVADDKLYGTFVDAMLCGEAPVEESAGVFQEIIKQILHKENSDDQADIAKLSRWLRCLFQLSLDSNIDVAENVLDQTYALVRDNNSGTQSQSSYGYPEEELEWLSATAFNRAVDFYLASDDDSCRRWAQKALDIAGLMSDKGLLYRVLKEKFKGLKFDD